MRLRVPTRSPAQLIGAGAVVLLWLASGAAAQTGSHGYAGGGFGIGQCIDGCGMPPDYEVAALIGGGFAYPLKKGKLWIAGDVNSHESNGYFDASGGPAVIVALGSSHDHRIEPFAQGGPRWGDGGLLGNVGAGANIWLSARLGVRVEYQYQWHNTTFYDQEYGPSGPVGPPTTSDMTLSEHVIRVGIAIR